MLIMKILPICDQMNFNIVINKPIFQCTDNETNILNVLQYDCYPSSRHGCRKCNSGSYFKKTCNSTCFMNDLQLFNPYTNERCLFLSDKYEFHKSTYKSIDPDYGLLSIFLNNNKIILVFNN